MRLSTEGKYDFVGDDASLAVGWTGSGGRLVTEADDSRLALVSIIELLMVSATETVMLCAAVP
jgi:hypothetical protein